MINQPFCNAIIAKYDSIQSIHFIPYSSAFAVARPNRTHIYSEPDLLDRISGIPKVLQKVILDKCDTFGQWVTTARLMETNLPADKQISIKMVNQSAATILARRNIQVNNGKTPLETLLTHVFDQAYEHSKPAYRKQMIAFMHESEQITQKSKSRIKAEWINFQNLVTDIFTSKIIRIASVITISLLAWKFFDGFDYIEEILETYEFARDYTQKHWKIILAGGITSIGAYKLSEKLRIAGYIRVSRCAYKIHQITFLVFLPHLLIVLECQPVVYAGIFVAVSGAVAVSTAQGHLFKYNNTVRKYYFDSEGRKARDMWIQQMTPKKIEPYVNSIVPNSSKFQ
jgi:hypothetical protein